MVVCDPSPSEGTPPTARGAPLVLAALALLPAWVEPAAAAPQQTDVAQAAAFVVDQTNAIRQEHQLPPLTLSQPLTRTAAAFAAHMAGTDRYGHEADGRTPAQRAQAHGYDFCSVAENIAFLYSSAGFDTASLAGGFVGGWRDSPPHRRNMLRPEATETGVAVARSSGSGRYYAVQMLGRPATMRARFRIVNAAAQPFDYDLDGNRHELQPGATRTHTQCEGGAIALNLSGEGRPRRLQASDGGRYVVGGGPGRWRLDGAP